MGGGRRFEYPKWVWSPAGGWWANPVHWRRNSVLYLVGASMVAYAAYTYAEPRTVSQIDF